MAANVDAADVHAFGEKVRGSALNPTNGVLAIVLLSQLGVYLTAIENPTLLPGNWTPLVPGMTFYIFSTFAALYLTNRPGALVGGTLETFLFRLAVGMALTWGVISVVFLSSAKPPELLGGTKLLYILYTAVFIAPTEELLFRATIPRLQIGNRTVGWFWGSVVGFALYHVPVYALTNHGVTAAGFFGNIISVAVLGAVLWGAYTLKWPTVRLGHGSKPFPLGGLGLSVGVHFMWDVFAFGALLALPLALVGLGA